MFLFDEVDFIQQQNLPVSNYWYFLPFGYLLTILIETPILYFCLPSKLSAKQRLLCGVWLTACTYPLVVLVFPALLLDYSRTLYLLVAESVAHFGECVLFWLAFRGRADFETVDWARAFVAILLANFVSFSFGEILNYFNWFGLF